MALHLKNAPEGSIYAICIGNEKDAEEEEDLFDSGDVSREDLDASHSRAYFNGGGNVCVVGLDGEVDGGMRFVDRHVAAGEYSEGGADFIRLDKN